MTSPKGIFVAGTDTGVGKTRIATVLLRALAAQGTRAIGMKPVSAGIGADESGNADVAALAAASNVDAPLADRSPYAFAPAVAPHLAAAQAGATIDLAVIAAAYTRLAARADAVVVEGAGGVLVPLDDRHDMLDIPATLGLRVLLVVGMRLGCLNHALLAALAVRTRGVCLAGWVANLVDPAMALPAENIATLTARLPAPLVATVAFRQPAQFADAWLAQWRPA